ncbi:MAG: galactokinase family protein [Planctomycetota bacterium]
MGQLTAKRADQKTLKVFAPGRVNLIGEHVDYSGGPVLPFPLPGLGTTISGRRSPELRATSDACSGAVRLHAAQRGRGWGLYLSAAWDALRVKCPGVGGWTGAVSSNLPIGAGLSSSASLLVAALQLWNRLYSLRLGPPDIAHLAWLAETRGVGKPVGPMDPYAIALGRAGSALLFDCASLNGRHVPLPPAYAVVFHSGISRALAGSQYGKRRAQCEAAAKSLGVRRLAQAREEDLWRLKGAEHKRAKHVVGECSRVHSAARLMKRGETRFLGNLLITSHESLRTDHEVSLPAVDRQVLEARAAGALGARMVGGGFGGAILAIFEKGDPRGPRFARCQRRVLWSGDWRAKT